MEKILYRKTGIYFRFVYCIFKALVLKPKIVLFVVFILCLGSSNFIYALHSDDFSATATTVPSYLILGQAPFSITGKVLNLGTDTITSFTMNYKINGGPVVSGNIDSVHVIPSSTYTFTHPVSWVPVSRGTYSIDTWASNLNGNNDQDTTNDHLVFNVEVLDTFVTRNSCIEVFTGTWCHPCHVANLAFDNNVLPNIHHYTLIKYHVGAADPFTTSESECRFGFYSLSGVPTFEFDGQEQSSQPTSAIFKSYQTLPSFMSVVISGASYLDTTVFVCGTITPLIDTGEYFYHIIITEIQDSLPYSILGETVTISAMMKLQSVWGTPIMSLTKKSPISFNKAIPISCCHVQNMANLRVVVLVQNFNDKKIEQSAWRNVTLSDTVIQTPKTIAGISLYPNPAHDKVIIAAALSHYDHYIITITDVAGRQLSEIIGESPASFQKEIDVSKLAPGIYFVSLKLNGGYAVEKFVKE